MSGGFARSPGTDPAVRAIGKVARQQRGQSAPITAQEYANLLARIANLESATGTTPPPGTITT